MSRPDPVPPPADPDGRFPFWLFPHLLALDAPAVAVVWQRFLGATFGVTVPVAASVGLTAAVWGIYLADRVLDARKPPRPDTDRHRFAARFARPLSLLAGCSFLIGLASAALLPLRYILVGMGVAAASGVYLLVVHAVKSVFSTRGWKELFVGGVFAAGVAVPLLAESASLDWLSAVVSFGLCCWWNCRLIDRWEEHRATGRTAGRLIGLAAAAFAVASPPAVRLALLAALALLLIVDAATPIIGVRLARVLADLVLLTPLPVWALTWATA